MKWLTEWNCRPAVTSEPVSRCITNQWKFQVEDQGARKERANSIIPQAGTKTIDVLLNCEDILTTAKLFLTPDSVCEVRVPEKHWPGKGTQSRFFRDTDADKIVEYVQGLDKTGAKNIYVTLNPVNPAREGKARDEDILRRRWILIDLDPDRPSDVSATWEEKELASDAADAIRNRLLPTMGEPVRCDSGNGTHLLYPCDMPNTGEAKEVVARLLGYVKGGCKVKGVTVDTSVGNAARITKLYGTWARKGEHTEERPHRVSRILSVPADCARIVSTVESLLAFLPEKGKRKALSAPSKQLTIEEIYSRAECELRSAGHPDNCGYNFFARGLRYNGYREEIADEHVEKWAQFVIDCGIGNPEPGHRLAVARRNKESAYSGDPVTSGWDASESLELFHALQEMNRKHFVVGVAGQQRIASPVKDSFLGRERLVFSRERDIILKYLNRKFPVADNKERDLGSIWLGAKNRRTYDQIEIIPKGECPPEVYNLWKGFSVKAVHGQWDAIKRHLLEVVCSGEKSYFDWLVRWFARCVQEPDKQAETAVVLRGLKGCGKGVVAEIMKRIFLNHYVTVSQPKHLVGNFNSHLRDCLFLFADESFWSGDKAGEQVLKALITERWLTVEEKYVPAVNWPNMLKILMAANADWVVPASADERRFFVLDVSGVAINNRPYFDTLWAAIKGDETGHMLHDLLKMDLSAWDHRRPPHTAALNRQKTLSLDSVGQWWYDCITDGTIGEPVNCWPDRVDCPSLHKAYLKHASEHKVYRPLPSNWLTVQLAKYLPVDWPKAHTRDRPRTLKLPKRDAAEKAFNERMNIDEPGQLDLLKVA